MCHCDAATMEFPLRRRRCRRRRPAPCAAVLLFLLPVEALRIPGPVRVGRVVPTHRFADVPASGAFGVPGKSGSWSGLDPFGGVRLLFDTKLVTTPVVSREDGGDGSVATEAVSVLGGGRPPEDDDDDDDDGEDGASPKAAPLSPLDLPAFLRRLAGQIDIERLPDAAPPSAPSTDWIKTLVGSLSAALPENGAEKPASFLPADVPRPLLDLLGMAAGAGDGAAARSAAEKFLAAGEDAAALVRFADRVLSRGFLGKGPRLPARGRSREPRRRSGRGRRTPPCSPRASTATTRWGRCTLSDRGWWPTAPPRISSGWSPMFGPRGRGAA